MKYEIINPSDKCYIAAEDQKLAIIACALLGQGWYGLENVDNGKCVLYPLQSLDKALGMTEEEIQGYIDCNKTELSKVFDSFEYADERTSLTNIRARSKQFGEALRDAGANK